MSGERTRVLAALLTTYLVWGSTYAAISIAIGSIPPLLMCGTRFLVAGAILYAWCAWQRRRRPGTGWVRPTWRHWRATAVVGLLLPAAGTGGASWAEQSIPSGLTALLLATIPLWTTVTAAVAERERITLLTVVGLGAGLAGTAVLVNPFGSAAPPVWPVVVALAGALAWGCGTVYSRRAEVPAQPLLGSGMQMISAGIALLIVGAATGEVARVRPAEFSAASGLALVYLIVAGSLIAYTAFGYLNAHAPARLVGTYAFVNPLVAVLLGFLLLGEDLQSSTLLATALIAGSIALLLLRPPRAAGASSPAVE